MKYKSISMLINVLFVFNSHALYQNSIGYIESKYELKIELPKYTYKKFEPVILKIELINHDSIPLELWGNFEPSFYLTDVVITDEHSNISSVNHSVFLHGFLTAPTNIIPPKDTLVLSMSINDWGKRARFVSHEDNDIYFGNRGYFENGKYDVKIITRINRTTSDLNIRGKIRTDTVSRQDDRGEIKSNNVYFEVVELNDTDKEILNQFNLGDFLYNLKPYKDIIEKFPDNAFTEAIHSYYLGGKYLNHYKNKDYIYFNDLNKDYEDFITKYPNSLYLLNPRVVEPYVYRYFIDINTNLLKNDFEQLYADFLNQSKYNMLKYFLKNKWRVRMILNLEM